MARALRQIRHDISDQTLPSLQKKRLIAVGSLTSGVRIAIAEIFSVWIKIPVRSGSEKNEKKKIYFDSKE